MFSGFSDVLTVKELAKALGIGLNKAYELINNGQVGYKRVGRKILVPKFCLIEYLKTARYKVCL